MVFICRLWCATENIHEDACIVKAVWVKHYGDLTVMNWSRWKKYCSLSVIKPVG